MPGKQWDSTANELAKQLERHRYECEIRQLLIYRTKLGLTGFRGYFANTNFDKRRQQIAGDFYDQWKKGNRGEPGKWL
jgi:hypothetical protein